MQFQVGDCVVHPAHGVGQIVKLEERRFGEDAQMYYEVCTDKLTVWVPVDKNGGLGLRPITKKAELAYYRQILKNHPEELNEDHRARHSELVENLKSGSFKTVCEVVRNLTARSWNKTLTESDGNSLRRAQDILYQEWAAVTGSSVDEAAVEINSLLKEAEQMYADK